MKKYIVVCCALVGAGVDVFAYFDISFHVKYYLQSAYRKQKPQYVTNVNPGGQASENHKRFAFKTYAENSVLIKRHEDSLLYGANINIDTKTDYNNKFTTHYDRTYLFLENKLGKLELGSNFSAATLMSYGAHSVASATGGASNGDWGFNIYDPTRAGGSDSYSNHSFQQWIDLTYLLRRGDDNPIKISYFSPKALGIQVGISFIPDTVNVVSVYNQNVDKTVEFKNLVSLAATYDLQINENEKILFSLAYNRAAAELDQDLDHDEIYDGLNEIVVGSKWVMGKFSFAGSYSDAKHFGQTLVRNNVAYEKYRNKFYTLGMSYDLNEFSSSITYVHQKLLQGSGSDVPVDITKALSFGVDYALYKGFKFYAEITRFSIINSWYQLQKNQPKNKGKVLLLGTKIKI